MAEGKGKTLPLRARHGSGRWRTRQRLSHRAAAHERKRADSGFSGFSIQIVSAGKHGPESITYEKRLLPTDRANRDGAGASCTSCDSKWRRRRASGRLTPPARLRSRRCFCSDRDVNRQEGAKVHLTDALEPAGLLDLVADSMNRVEGKWH